MTEHTATPWHTTSDGYFAIRDAKNRHVLEVIGRDTTMTEDMANMQRIVACVNWLAGVPTEMLERFSLWDMKSVLSSDYQKIYENFHYRDNEPEPVNPGGLGAILNRLGVDTHALQREIDANYEDDEDEEPYLDEDKRRDEAISHFMNYYGHPAEDDDHSDIEVVEDILSHIPVEDIEFHNQSMSMATDSEFRQATTRQKYREWYEREDEE